MRPANKNALARSIGFNPRICKRCDVEILTKDTVKVVSIHASVKDATMPDVITGWFLLCFNPRICKRCDFVILVTIGVITGFNPRICKRCDHPIRQRNKYQ